MKDDRFLKAEHEYFRLKGQYDTGRLTSDQFDAALKELMIEDAHGHFWLLGKENGKWSVHDGNAWIEADPYTPGVAAASLAPAKPRSEVTHPIILIAAIAVVALMGIGALIFAWSRGYLNSGAGGSPRVITPILPPTTPTRAPGTPSSSAFADETSSIESLGDASVAIPTLVGTPLTSADQIPTATPLPGRPPTPAGGANSNPAPPPSRGAGVTAGIFVTNLRTQFGDPGRKRQVAFYAAFNNASGSTRDERWCAEIFRAAQTDKSMGISSCLNRELPRGLSEFGPSNYEVTVPGGCEAFQARVVALDDEGARIPFSSPGGGAFWYSFQVCP